MFPVKSLSDDYQIGAIHQFGGCQHPVIAWSVIGRRDWIDYALEWPHRAAMEAQKAVLEQRRLNGQRRLIDNGQPSPGR